MTTPSPSPGWFPDPRGAPGQICFDDTPWIPYRAAGRAGAMSRRRSRSSGGGGFVGLIGLLVIVGIIIKFIWWILGAAALIGLCFLIRALLRENNRRQEAAARHCAAIVARADQQHQWVMQGDDRGIYGPEGAKLMHDIRRGGTQATRSREPQALSTFGPPVVQPRVGPFGTRFAR